MKYKILFSIFLIYSIASCNDSQKKSKLIVFPEYCAGCVSKNFSAINLYKLHDNFSVYFDSTDQYVLEIARTNNINYTHISDNEIRSKFGDFANILVIKPGKEPIELMTNEVLEKNIHY